MQARTISINEALDAGIELAMAGRHREAAAYFRGVLVHEPANFEAIERLGTSLFSIGQKHEAFFLFWRGRKLAPTHPLALANYGMALVDLGEIEEGVKELERAEARARKMPQLSDSARALIFNNLGNALEKSGRYEEALRALESGLALRPKDEFAQYNRGIVLSRLGRYAEAIEVFDRVLERNPADPDVRYNRGLAHLLLGNLAQGFADYEYRLLTSDNPKPNFGLPAGKRLNGSQDIAGRTVLLYCEQGLGDDIQFFRFIGPLLDLGPSRLKIVTHTATLPLLPRHEAIEVLRPGDPLGDYDHWVALMSLPYCFGITEESQIPAPFSPPIEEDRIAAWKERIGAAASGRLRVGVCWAGNFRHKNDAFRSIRLREFARLFETDGCFFVSLQQLRREDEELFGELARRHGVASFALDDFRETAAIIKNVDIVVSADTAVAHLAASVGTKTLILVPDISTDWRWQIGRSDSPWYPQATIFRRRGSWRPTLEEVREYLKGRG